MIQSTSERNSEAGPSRSKTWRRLWWMLLTPVLLVGLAVGAFVLQGLYGGRVTRLDQLQHREHLLYQEVDPVSRNYLQVVEDLQMEGVTAENNFAVTVLELTRPRGTAGPGSGYLDPGVYTRFRKRFPLPETQPLLILYPGALEQRLQQLADDAREGTIPEFAPAQSDIGRLYASRLTKTAKDERDWKWIGQMLAVQGPGLDYLVQQVQQRTRFAYPFAGEPIEDHASFQISSAAGYQKDWLSCRSQYRIHQGNWEGAWTDTRAIFQIAQRLAAGPTYFEYARAQQSQSIGLDCLGQLLNLPDITPQRLDAMEAELPELLALPDGFRQRDLETRARASQWLDQVFSQGRWESWQQDFGQNQPPAIYPGWMDNEAILDRINQRIDRYLQQLKSPDPDLDWLSFRRDWIQQLKDLEPAAGDWHSPVRSTCKMAELELAKLCGLSEPPSTERQVSVQRLLQLAIAARRYQWDTGALPERLDQLKDRVAEETMQDPFTRAAWHCEMVDGQLRIWGANRLYAMTRPPAFEDDGAYKIAIQLVELDRTAGKQANEKGSGQ